MPPIYYETKNGDVHQIDDVSQRALVYVYLHGSATPEDLVEPAGAENGSAVHARITNQLGGSSAGLVDTETSTQKTLGDRADQVIHSIILTETGEEFIHNHRAEMSMPVDLAELAKKVAELQIDDHIVDDLRNRVDRLEEQLEDS